MYRLTLVWMFLVALAYVLGRLHRSKGGAS